MFSAEVLDDARKNLERGRHVSDTIRAHLATEPPPIHPPHRFYLAAFHQLGTCRAIGMSVGPIPWRDVVAYGEHYGLDGIALHDFVQIVYVLDRAYLASVHRR